MKVKTIRKYLPLYLMMLPGIVYLIINNYIPMAGIVVAFKKYTVTGGLFGSPWNGLDNFEYLFRADAWTIIRNTLSYNIVFILLNMVVGIALAIMISDVTSKRARKLYQSSVMLPFLISIVIISYIVFAFLGGENGMVMATLMAYPLSLKDLPGRKIFSFFVFFTMLFSGGLVPSYLMWTGIFNIKNSIMALIIPNLMLSAVDVMLIRTYFSTSIPTAIYEAAMIDGASHLRIFTRIVLPLGKPIIVTVTVFAGLNYWNDWTNGLYYISKHELYSIQTLLNKMIQDIQALQMNAAASSNVDMSIPQVSIRMAIAFVALAPILVIFPFLQKYFETLNGVKRLAMRCMGNCRAQ